MSLKNGVGHPNDASLSSFVVSSCDFFANGDSLKTKKRWWLKIRLVISNHMVLERSKDPIVVYQISKLSYTIQIPSMYGICSYMNG